MTRINFHLSPAAKMKGGTESKGGKKSTPKSGKGRGTESGLVIRRVEEEMLPPRGRGASGACQITDALAEDWRQQVVVGWCFSEGAFWMAVLGAFVQRRRVQS